ncbi:MAG: phosphate butyryltransferase [Alloprevotella sp.]|nr:phosphate butyryltransferase [Alloprevotella sp.]
MKSIQSFSQLTAHLREKGVRKRVAVICGSDDSTRHAIERAEKEGFAEAIRVDGEDAPARAVELVREGKADILMKGLVNTNDVLRAVLDKEKGILPKGNVLTHITAADIPGHDRLIFFTDPAVIPYPTQEQRRAQVAYVARLCHNFGIAEPRISLIHCNEKVSEKHFPHTAGYAQLREEAERGDFGPCIVDGPLDLKTSCCLESMRTKGIQSPIEGKADALIFPDIEAANVFYKTVTLFCHAETACALQGTLAPVVLPSRADSTESKFYSLALACLA